MITHALSLCSPRYENARRLRVAIIHGMARMAALMASTYKPYLGIGLGPLSVGLFIKAQNNQLNQPGQYVAWILMMPLQPLSF